MVKKAGPRGTGKSKGVKVSHIPHIYDRLIYFHITLFSSLLPWII